MRTFNKLLHSAVLCSLFLSSGHAEEKCPFADITKFAADNCAAYASSGSETTTNAQAGLNAGLGGLVRKIFRLDVNADAEVGKKVKAYEGPLQAQLVQYAKDRETCREHFADKLLDLFCKPITSAPVKPAIEATLCTGEYEGNCPGPHNLYLGCPNRTSPDMIAMFCPSKHGSLTPIKTGISGNNCGYSLLHLVCTN